MAITHTPPDRQKTLGNKLAGDLNALETASANILATIRTIVEAIDGGEGNAADTTKMAGVQEACNFKRGGTPANDAATAAIGELQAVRAVLVNGQAALDQAFARLRG